MEITNSSVQTVNAGSNVLYTAVPIAGGCSIIYRAGSGVVTLRGLTNQCRARYRVTFNANVGIPSGGTVAPIILSYTYAGEADPVAVMISSPAAVSDYNSVSRTDYVDVPQGCCLTLAVQNIGTAAINVENASLMIERVA